MSENEVQVNWDVSKTIYIAKKGDGGLYEKQYDDAVKMIEQVVDFLDFNPIAPNDTRIAHGNTVVGISGERGTGKTSFLHSLEARMEEQVKSVYSLGCVEPSEFDSNMSALELFLAQLYAKYKDIQDKLNKPSDIYAAPRINKVFKEISKALSVLRMDKSVYSSENPGIEILNDMVNLTEMRKNIEKLCREFLGVINSSELRGKEDKKCLALFIDDADLIKNDCIYQLLEDIRKYLSGNVIIVISFRQSQLIDSVCDHLIHENEDLLKRDILSVDSLRGQTEDFIEKVIPQDRTIYLFNQVDLMGKRVLDVFRALRSSEDSRKEPEEDSREKYREELLGKYLSPSNMAMRPKGSFDSDEGPTVAEWLDSALYYKTLIGIKPVNEQENVSFLWPRNLRELITLARIIHDEMDDPWQEEVNSFAVCSENLERYRAYFINNLMETFSPSILGVLNRWLNADVEEKNYVAYAEFFKLLYQKLENSTAYPNNNGIVSQQSIFTNLLSIDLMLPSNVTFGDIYTIINSYISAAFDNDSGIYLGYSFKILYSIELLSFLLNAICLKEYEDDGEDKRSFLYDYYALLNSSILPPERAAYDLVREVYIPTEDEYEQLRMEYRTSDAFLDGETVKWSMSFGEYKSILSRGISPRTKLATARFRSSRPRRTVEGARAGIGQYRPYYNQRIFYTYYSDESAIDTDQRLDKGAYSFSLLNIFAQPLYVDSAMKEIALNEGGAYLFYNAFDLDVFVRLTYQAKKATPVFVEEMRRLNSAVAYSVSRGAVNLKSDSALKGISLSYEKSLFEKIRFPFSKTQSDSFRLFYSEDSGELLSYASFKEAFWIEKILKEANRLALNMPELLSSIFEQSSKWEAADYLELFEQTLNEKGFSSEARDARTLIEELRTPNSQFSVGRKDRIEKLVRKCPVEARAAYREWKDEER